MNIQDLLTLHAIDKKFSRLTVAETLRDDIILITAYASSNKLMFFESQNGVTVENCLARVVPFKYIRHLYIALTSVFCF